MIDTLNILAQTAAPKGGGLSTIIMMALLFVVMWVVMIRPQQKKRKELEKKQQSLKAGVQVVTIGGLHGTVNAVNDHTVSLRIADGVFVKYEKSAIASVQSKDEQSETKSKKEDACKPVEAKSSGG